MDEHKIEDIAQFRRNISQLFSTASAFDQIAAILESHEWTILSLRSDIKSLRDSVIVLQTQNQLLKNQYSELLYKFTEAVRASK